MISQPGLVALTSLIGLTGCAEGDNLFADAGATRSGVYAQRLAAQQQQVDAERSRTAALNAQNSELKKRSASLDAAVDQERRDLAALRASIERLDRDIRSRQLATAEGEAKRDELERQLAGILIEIAALEQQLATGPASTAKLQQHKARTDELKELRAQLHDQILRFAP